MRALVIFIVAVTFGLAVHAALNSALAAVQMVVR